MTLHLNLPGTLGIRHSEQQQQQMREARKELKNRVRTDWEYPTLPAHRSCGRPSKDAIVQRVAGFKTHHQRHKSSNVEESSAANSPELDFEPTDWRERQYTSGSDSGDESGDVAASGGSSSNTSNSGSKAKQKAYKFDTPDSVGAELSERQAARKRKRQQALEAEMQWNDGLAHWLQRRNVWCCAHTAAQVQALKERQQQQAASPELPPSPPPSASPSTEPDADADADASSTRTTTSATASIASANSTPPTSAPNSRPTTMANKPADGGAESADEEHENGQQEADAAPDPRAAVAPSSSSSSSASPSAPASQHASPSSSSSWLAPPPSPPPALAVQLPIPPPLLPNHPVRRRIGAHMHAEIYSKVIVQGRAPSVPLNLAVVLRALVAGWKADGEWPPKAAAVPEKSSVAGRRKKKLAAGAAAGSTGASAATASANNEGAGGGGGGGGGLRQSVKAVGRALRLTMAAGSEA